MDTEKRRALTIVYAATALKQLDDNWDWNEERYITDHADKYVEFLRRQIDLLAEEYDHGKFVGSRPDLRYVLIRRKSKGHGHVAVYRVTKRQVDLLYVFHSAQDWQTKLRDELH